MEIQKIYSELDVFFGNFKIFKQSDEKLKKIDCYYIDEEKRKFIFACKVYDNKQNLFNEWEQDQDSDIALYLQNDLFPRDEIRWDTYFLIIYSGKELIDFEEYHNIERDRFCCKKIFVNLSVSNSLDDLLNFKLPVTHNFYQLKKIDNYITNEVFFKQLRKECGLNSDLFPDELLTDLDKKRIEFLDKLRRDDE